MAVHTVRFERVTPTDVNVKVIELRKGYTVTKHDEDYADWPAGGQLSVTDHNALMDELETADIQPGIPKV